MLKNGRPYHLPQVSMPYNIMVDKLSEEGVGYEFIEIEPSDDDNIKSLQNVVFSNEIENITIDDLNPIWLSDDGDYKSICDGHHRYFSALVNEIPIKAILIKLCNVDACRLLNKIQDIYEYEQSKNLEEVETQNAINFYGDDQNQYLNTLEEDNTEIQTEYPAKNEVVIIAYRKDPIKENSSVGNFFTLKPISGFSKYEISFDNLLDTSALGVTYKDGQEPVDILSKSWFPHVNFEKLSSKYGISSTNFKNKSIAEKAIKMGYDGIKYGDSLIQGLK